MRCRRSVLTWVLWVLTTQCPSRSRIRSGGCRKLNTLQEAGTDALAAVLCAITDADSKATV